MVSTCSRNKFCMAEHEGQERERSGQARGVRSQGIKRKVGHAKEPGFYLTRSEGG